MKDEDTSCRYACPEKKNRNAQHLEIVVRVVLQDEEVVLLRNGVDTLLALKRQCAPTRIRPRRNRVP